jgi:hypothetical protein
MSPLALYVLCAVYNHQDLSRAEPGAQRDRRDSHGQLGEHCAGATLARMLILHMQADSMLCEGKVFDTGVYVHLAYTHLAYARIHRTI